KKQKRRSITMKTRTLSNLALGLGLLAGSALTATSLPAAHADAAHPVINTPCPADVTLPCISAWEPRIAPAGPATVTGYISAAPGTLTLFINSPSAGLLYTTTTTSTAMTGDYMGYSSFRFTVPDTQIGERNEYLTATVGVASAMKMTKTFRVSNA